jgi:hypothetical protein
VRCVNLISTRGLALELVAQLPKHTDDFKEVRNTGTRGGM